MLKRFRAVIASWTMTLALLAVIPSAIHAQNNNVVEKYVQEFSPNAAELGKYGKVPVSYFNGLPDIRVPLYDLKARNYTLPIYLSYYAGGHRTEQHPGWVGLGWTLHAGGCINRIINGYKDEMTYQELRSDYPGILDSTPGYFDRMTEVGTSEWMDSSVLDGAFNAVLARDRMPDEFQINIEDIHASFYFVGENQVKIVSKTPADFTVECHLNDGELHQSEGYPGSLVMYRDQADTSKTLNAHLYRYIDKLIVTNKDGTRYHFGGDKTSIEFSIRQRYNHEAVQINPSYHVWNAVGTANTWMLTKIERPDGEEITFTYEKNGIPIVRRQVQRIMEYDEVVYTNQNDMNHYVFWNTFTEMSHGTRVPYLGVSYSFLMPSYLKRISCKQSSDFVSINTLLSQELEYGFNETEFEYLVGRFDDATRPFPPSYMKNKSWYRKVNSINTPSCSYSLIYDNPSTGRLHLGEVRRYMGPGIRVSSYKMTYNPTMLPSYGARKSDVFGFYNGIDQPSSAADTAGINTRCLSTNSTLAQAEMLTRLYYPTGGYTDFEYELHRVSKKAKQYPFVISTTMQHVGGLRIKKITDYPSSGIGRSRTFSYESAPGVSSGILSGDPRCHIEGHLSRYAGLFNTPVTDYYHIYEDVSITPLSLTDGNHVTYSMVKETFGDGAYCIYRYSNHDTPGCLDSLSFNSVGTITGRMFGDTFTSRELGRGLLLSQEEYSSDGSLVRKTENEYNVDETKYIPSVSCTSTSGNFAVYYRMNYDRIFCYYPYLKKQTITTWPDSGSGNAVETVQYIYNSHRDVRSEKRQNGTSSIENKVFYSGDLSGPICSAMKLRGIMNRPVETQIIRDNALVSSKLVVYSQEHGIFVPAAEYEAALGSGCAPAQFSLSNGNTMDSRYYKVCDYADYDGYGNPTLLTDSKGVLCSIEWGHNGMYPVNLIRNAYSGAYEQYTCTYHPIYGLTSITDGRGITTSYEYDYMGRLVGVKDNNGNDIKRYEYHYKLSDAYATGYNYIKTLTPLSEDTDSSAVTINYFNNLGEPSQTVLVGGSPSGGSLYDAIVYDAVGRPVRQYLPFSVQNDGNAIITALGYYAIGTYSDTFAYSESTYKAVPDVQKIAQRGPGREWNISDKKQTFSYQIGHPSNTNTRVTKFSVSFGESDNITISRTGYGAVGEHSILVTTDEDGHVVREFNDISGKTIQMIKEDHTNSGTEYLITYYVYDKAGRLVAVLPPILSDCLTGASSWSSSDCDEIKQYGYFYRYDAKGRQIAKKIPGADWVYYIYDKNGRQILSQDGNQRSRGEWTFFLEDHIGRPCLKGIWVNQDLDPFNSPYGNVNVYVIKNSSNTALYGYLINGMTLTSPKVHIVNWWDNYSFPINMGIEASYDSVFHNTANADAPYTTSSRGLRTGGLVRTLGENNENHYLWDVCWYNDKAQPVQTVRMTAIGDVIREGYAYDFTGNVIRKYVKHSVFDGSTVTESYTYSYDKWGRPLVSSLRLNGGTPVILHNYSYDAVGRVIWDCQSDTTGSVVSAINHNVRSGITNKLVATSVQDTLFFQRMDYQNGNGDTGVTPRWNGSVSAMTWSNGSGDTDHQYKYLYDGLGRLISANCFEGGNLDAENSMSYEYDKHGNIVRKESEAPFTGTYLGNQLVSSANTSSNISIGRTKVVFSYDSNGNRVQSRRIKPPFISTTVAYNVLNLPSHITRGDDEYHYVYSASGELLSRTWAVDDIEEPIYHKKDYSGNMVYIDSTLTAVLVDGGYFLMTEPNPSFHVLVTDAQGNVRVDTRTDGTEKKVYNYSPYGETITTNGAESTVPDNTETTYENPYRFGGKEWNENLGIYDFGARYYIPGIIPSWTTMDPLCEKYFDISPYSYCAGDPVNLVDPDGNSTWVIQIGQGLYSVYGGDLNDNDLNVYLYYKNKDGEYVRGESIGRTTSITSFYNSDKKEGEVIGWMTDMIIDMNDSSGKDFLNRIVDEQQSLFGFALDARKRHINDFKYSNGTANESDDGRYPYRGMPIGTTSSGKPVISSARDIGNMAAGYKAGISGLTWKQTRAAFDGYQSIQSRRIDKEGKSTVNAEFFGWSIGYSHYIKR
ncbi:MAG: RHS repeat-associated core domain-containing protein [Bacteroidales bacterium]|nr:RHS repeat-associated core domain-containing protein [Bacteroidales bacterium]